jgi:hypothetical protein
MRWASSLLAVCVLAGAGCGSPSAPPATASTTPLATRSPSSGTPSGFVSYVSSRLPYEGCYPRSYEARLDWVTFGGALGGDAFVGGSPGHLAEVFSIVAEPVSGYTTTRYVDDVLANLRGAGLGVEVLDSLSVDGVLAERLRFNRLTAQGQRYTVQQVVWASGTYGWVAGVSSAPADADRVAGMLRTMLGCFRAR